MIFAGSRFSNHVACENRQSYGGRGAFTWKTITSAIALGIFGPIYHLACRNKSRALPRMGRGGGHVKKGGERYRGGAEGVTRWKTIAIAIALGTLGPVPSWKKTLNPNQRRQRGDTTRNPKPLNPKPCYHAGGGGGYITSYKD